jgi:hypothetical protein
MLRTLLRLSSEPRTIYMQSREVSRLIRNNGDFIFTSGTPCVSASAETSQSTSLLSPMLENLPPLAQSLSQPPLGSSSSDGSAPRTSKHHYPSTFLSTLTALHITPTWSRFSLSYLLLYCHRWIVGLHRRWVDLCLKMAVPTNYNGQQDTFVFPPVSDVSLIFFTCQLPLEAKFNGGW